MSGRNSPKSVNIRQQNRRIDTETKLVKYIKNQLGDPLVTVDVTDDQIFQCIDDAFEKFSEWTWNAQQSKVFVIEADPGIQDYLLDDRVKAISGLSLGDGLNGYGKGGGMGFWGGIPMGDIIPPMYVPAITLEGQASSLSVTGSGLGLSATGVAGGIAGGPNTSSSGTGNPVESYWAALSNMQTMQSMMGQRISYDFNASNHILRIFEPVSGPVAIECEMDYIPNPDFDMAYGHSFIKNYSLNLVKRVWGGNVGKYSSPLVGGATINFDRLISEAQMEIDRLEESLMMSSEALGVFSG